MNAVDESGQDPFPPQGVDLDRPSVARVYDYFLGGHTNWAIDREFGDRILAALPITRRPPRPIASSLTALFVTSCAAESASSSTSAPVYPPWATSTQSRRSSSPAAPKSSTSTTNPSPSPTPKSCSKSKAIAADTSPSTADLRAPQRLWRQVTDTGLIDFSEPVAVFMIAVLHVRQANEQGSDIGDQIVAHYRKLLPRGSYLAISHATDEGVPAEITDTLAQLKSMYDTSSSPVIWRSHTQIADLFGDFHLVDPGLTWTSCWHPEEADSRGQHIAFSHPSESIIYAGVGRKP